MNDFDKIKDILSVYRDLEVYKASPGHGTFITFDFSDREAIRSKKSDYHLWIYLCEWKIYSKETLLWSSDALEREEEFDLEESFFGRKLEDIFLDNDKVYLMFSGNICIELSEMDDSKEDDFFILYQKNVKALSYSKNLGFYLD